MRHPAKKNCDFDRVLEVLHPLLERRLRLLVVRVLLGPHLRRGGRRPENPENRSPKSFEML